MEQSSTSSQKIITPTKKLVGVEKQPKLPTNRMENLVLPFKDEREN